MNSLSYLNQSIGFPPPEHALTEPNGLLAIGGDLQPQRLMKAYYEGIFPWFNASDPILWWSPDPRAVFKPTAPFGSKSLLKFLKKSSWRYTINHAFLDVLAGCAAPRNRQDGTWISAEIQMAYYELHLQGKAHSIEVWDQEHLVGGLYGLPIGKVFCGESMFHRQTNASKAAFAILNQHLVQHDFQLIDAQVMNPHLLSLGAKALPRADFLHLLHQYRDNTIAASIWAPQEVLIEF
ncbi:leucyl/phenylalanyl-tRNA--protein transferase [Shewanella inventionis]|uniref:Leucyl/phenylalanyl-tRNA--protein transferase n=1 Tax=Shewanella inventionis TaxID=1738770 RepID=A0ABQ1ISF0_9GAMM|nr:leucyl/phenylalanyl-tRNA--protein transferase [Shewanella inventionis]MCL1157162.1 leucyl/phenylalanyl-tRNA--protein transferase [Shewanella inventionis]GGB49333.1 leucyl/phenylalanyl-tRNA--protein transferase [Shewanella inventionis]